MDDFSHLTRGERIERIGELLSKGITLLLLREAETRKLSLSRHTPTAPPDEVTGNGDMQGAPLEPLDETENTILEFLKRVGRASPRDLQRGLDLPKATLYRSLNRLVQAKIITRTGKTSAIRYTLAQPIPIVDAA